MMLKKNFNVILFHKFQILKDIPEEDWQKKRCYRDVTESEKKRKQVSTTKEQERKANCKSRQAEQQRYMVAETEKAAHQNTTNDIYSITKIIEGKCVKPTTNGRRRELISKLATLNPTNISRATSDLPIN
ncbi:hypothetical protein DPMN_103230 [Dreissena polymorpha]|uniref:Uncharacterized protein n=1 Tax=Dreissena polymorpha TaxID=45954 RepID=A0A9D4H5L3_DREPO|nr:hypothetical protein DPMN_103230 [Dreissena polymorpha]